ncbi:MAG: hypothetical protein ABFR36_00075 [Acidobacteriota bacterium]
MLFLVFFLYLFEAAEESPGGLSRAHDHLNGAKSCFNCHDREYNIKYSKCLECHTALDKRIRSGKGYHQNKSEDCESCHQEHKGKGAELIQWDPKDFDHEETGYTLTGAHKKIKNCSLCHSGPNSFIGKNSRSYLLKETKCITCHEDAHNKMYPVCTDCHSTIDWRVDIWSP